MDMDDEKSTMEVIARNVHRLENAFELVELGEGGVLLEQSLEDDLAALMVPPRSDKVITSIQR